MLVKFDQWVLRRLNALYNLTHFVGILLGRMDIMTSKSKQLVDSQTSFLVCLKLVQYSAMKETFIIIAGH